MQMTDRRHNTRGSVSMYDDEFYVDDTVHMNDAAVIFLLYAK